MGDGHLNPGGSDGIGQALMRFHSLLDVGTLLLLVALELIGLLLQVCLHLPAPDELLVDLLDLVVKFHFLLDGVSGIERLAVFVEPVVLLAQGFLLGLWVRHSYVWWPAILRVTWHGPCG